MKKTILILALLVLSAFYVGAGITTEFPIASDLVTVSRPGYHTYVTEYTTSLYSDDFVPTIYLEPYREKKVTVKKYGIRKMPKMPITYDYGYYVRTVWEWRFIGSANELSQKEKVLLSITKKKDKPYEEDLFNVVIFSGGDEPKDIRLVPGKYDVEISIFYLPAPGKVIIPERTEKKRPCFVCRARYITYPEVSFDSILPLGNIRYEWTVSKNDLDMMPDLIEFFALEVDIPSAPVAERRHTDLQMLEKPSDFVEDYSLFNPKAEEEPVGYIGGFG